MNSPLAGRRVLVAEDEYFIAQELVSALTAAAAEILGPAASGEAALALLASEERIDVAVLDIDLKGESSFEVADGLRARHIPFIFATGYDGLDIPSAYGTVPRWQKPFETAALVEALERMLR